MALVANARKDEPSARLIVAARLIAALASETLPGAEGIRTSDLRSAGTRALHSAAASDSAGLTVEGAPLDPALDRRCFKSPVEVRASVHRRSSPRPSSFQIQVKS